ncbi:MAG: mannose-6-phosphate isomerase, partial [Myxococcaceae bacterium]|nr:mannose-6-phosphate isomerase [Myxococcaceae bacterium]
LELIEAAPEATLGPKVVQRYGRRLPYLLKLLAAAQPLSLQAHPSLNQAREGFERENALGIPITAAQRNYKDPNHKPELLCALTPFKALCGFRNVGQTASLFEALGQAGLAARVKSGAKVAFEYLMGLPKEEAAVLVEAVAAACRRHTGIWERECANAAQLQQLYPGDVGVVSALLLNYLELKPGEAIYLPAGNLHAYVGGLGVEVMANSDNVLRGGLTPKHVDVPELLKVLDFRAGPVSIVHPTREGEEDVYLTPASEFRLSRFSLERRSAQPARRGVELLICTEGKVTIGAMELRCGDSVLICANEGLYALSGNGVVYRVTVNE